jgi:cobalt-zinc-cadmium efflux system protein
MRAKLVHGTNSMIVPAHVDSAAIEDFLRQVPGVQGVHDLHIWGLSTRETALTAHLVMPDGHPGDSVLHGLVLTLRERFAIDHSTLQIEHGPACVECSLLTAVTAQPQHP